MSKLCQLPRRFALTSASPQLTRIRIGKRREGTEERTRTGSERAGREGRRIGKEKEKEEEKEEEKEKEKRKRKKATAKAKAKEKEKEKEKEMEKEKEKEKEKEISAAGRRSVRWAPRVASPHRGSAPQHSAASQKCSEK